MICPNCRNLVADGLSICDNCDHILDASFLGDVPGAAAGADATRIKAVPAAKGDDATKIRAMPTAPAPLAKGSGPETRIVSADSVKKPAGKAPAKASLYEDDGEQTSDGKASVLDMAAAPASTAEAVEDLGAQFRLLPQSEKLVIIGGASLVVLLALPWRSDRMLGDDPGMLTSAWPLVLVAAASMAVVPVRRQRALQKFRDLLLQLNVVLGLGAAAGCVAFMRSSLQVEKLRAGSRIVEQVNSSPAFGVYLGLLASIVMLAGGVKMWLDRESLPKG